MTGNNLFDLILLIWIGLAFVVYFVLTKVNAPYGRHVKTTWGPMLDHRLAWVIMELASPLSFAFFFLNNGGEKTMILWLFFYLWIFHYINRSIVFPLRAHMEGRQMPFLVMLFSIVFNGMNGYLNGYYLGVFAPPYPTSWLMDIRFVGGAFLFIAGLLINYNADKALIDLRQNGKKEYKIPHGGLYQYITCPNYFGEIIEWLGFAFMTWSLPGLAFALWTAANLLPRAAAHHTWYQANFADYPEDRKAVIPFLW
jgi:protein-S-isoprenylcysteine O-methyltransferase Ste14